MKAVFRYAVTHERIDGNPMLDLVPSEVLKARQVTHRPALADRDLPEFLAKLDAYEGDPHTVHALRLLILTAVRPGEVRGARWAEFDLDAAQWRIPGERMKMRAEHPVPLSRQALALLAHMQPLSGGGELVFPSPFYPSKPLSENTLNSALARMATKGRPRRTASARCFRRWPTNAGGTPTPLNASSRTSSATKCGLRDAAAPGHLPAGFPAKRREHGNKPAKPGKHGALQPLGQRLETLPAFDHLHMFPA